MFGLVTQPIIKSQNNTHTITNSHIGTNIYNDSKFSLVTEHLKWTSEYPLPIQKDGSSIYFDGIVIKCCDIDTIRSFMIKINDITIINIPFPLIMKLSKIMEKDGTCYIRFDDKLFSNTKLELPFSNQYYCIYVHLDTKRIITYNLMTIRKYYDSCIMNPIKYYISQYQTVSVKTNQYYDINLNCKLTGIFVESKYPLRWVKLSTDSNKHMEYDHLMLTLYDTLISKRTLWSKKHSLVFNTILNKIIPLDVIKLIESYCNDNYEYLYWFPVYPGLSYFDTNIYPNVGTITGNVTIVISIDYVNEHPKYGRECLVYIQNKNILKVDIDSGRINYKMVMNKGNSNNFARI